MSWTCAHCRCLNSWRETRCDYCTRERLRPLARMPGRPAEAPEDRELTPEEHAAIRRELARWRALLHLPPRPDTPPPEAQPTPVRVLARREVPPASRGWWRRSEAG